MNIIDRVITKIQQHPHSEASRVLARALASACSETCTINLYEVSRVLNTEYLDLLRELIGITQHEDYNRLEQQAALRWLRLQKWI